MHIRVHGVQTSEPVPTAIHFGVKCDGSGVAPITGVRYHKVGHDYDLCASEFSKLSEAERSQYEAIAFPGAAPAPCINGHGSAAVAAEPQGAKELLRSVFDEVIDKVHEAIDTSGKSDRPSGTFHVGPHEVEFYFEDSEKPGSVEAQQEQPVIVTHPHVICDGSNMCPIVGTRYHKIDHDYDLCASEFAKLPESERSQYEAIEAPGATPVPCGRDGGPAPAPEPEPELVASAPAASAPAAEPQDSDSQWSQFEWNSEFTALQEMGFGDGSHCGPYLIAELLRKHKGSVQAVIDDILNQRQ